jgi:hypothetical protein
VRRVRHVLRGWDVYDKTGITKAIASLRTPA